MGGWGVNNIQFVWDYCIFCIFKAPKVQDVTECHLEEGPGDAMPASVSP